MAAQAILVEAPRLAAHAGVVERQQGLAREAIVAHTGHGLHGGAAL